MSSGSVRKAPVGNAQRRPMNNNNRERGSSNQRNGDGNQRNGDGNQRNVNGNQRNGSGNQRNGSGNQRDLPPFRNPRNDPEPRRREPEQQSGEQKMPTRLADQQGADDPDHPCSSFPSGRVPPRNTLVNRMPMPLKKSTIQLLRLPFSFFLMPVFWFALGQVVDKDWWRALLIFVILHLLVYPASNGYNSYMDRDTTSIGGLQHPMQPTQQLFRRDGDAWMYWPYRWVFSSARILSQVSPFISSLREPIAIAGSGSKNTPFPDT